MLTDTSNQYPVIAVWYDNIRVCPPYTHRPPTSTLEFESIHSITVFQIQRRKNLNMRCDPANCQ